jgi:hypothetical protein
MKPVAADAILPVPVIRNSVEKLCGKHCLVPGGVQHRHVRNPGHELSGGLDSLNVGGIVQGRQIGEFLEGAQDLIIHNDRASEFLTAVDHAMPYRHNLGQAVQDAMFRMNEHLLDESDGVLMARAIPRHLHLGPSRHLLKAEGAADLDSFDDASYEDFPLFPAIHHVLHGGASTVQG